MTMNTTVLKDCSCIRQCTLNVNLVELITSIILNAAHVMS